MVKLEKNEMLGINGGGFIMGIKAVVSLFGKILFRSLLRW